MKSFPNLRWWLMSVITVWSGLSAAAGDVSKLRVVAVTDMTPAGRKLPAPSPEAPVYYQAVTTGYQDFGEVLAGEKEPPNDEFLQVVLRTLKKQGFLPANDQHPPTIVLGFSWGSLRSDVAAAIKTLGGDKLNIGWEAEPKLGLEPGVWMRGLRSETADRVMELAQDDLFVMNIAAYDRPALLKGKLVPLWQTRVASPTRGVWAADALPSIVQVAGPLIGRETATPQVTTVAEAFGKAGSVEIGDLEVVEHDIDLKTAPVLDLTKEKSEP